MKGIGIKAKVPYFTSLEGLYTAESAQHHFGRARPPAPSGPAFQDRQRGHRGDGQPPGCLYHRLAGAKPPAIEIDPVVCMRSTIFETINKLYGGWESSEIPADSLGADRQRKSSHRTAERSRCRMERKRSSSIRRTRLRRQKTATGGSDELERPRGAYQQRDAHRPQLEKSRGAAAAQRRPPPSRLRSQTLDAVPCASAGSRQVNSNDTLNKLVDSLRGQDAGDRRCRRWTSSSATSRKPAKTCPSSSWWTPFSARPSPRKRAIFTSSRMRTIRKCATASTASCAPS